MKSIKLRTCSLLLAAGLTSIVPALAQMPATTPALPATQTPPAAAPLDVAPDYKIAPGDVLSVGVMDFPNLSVPSAAVTPDGNASMPLIGRVMLAGKTLDEATTLLTTKLKKYVIDPTVTLSLVQKHAQRIVFSGAVNHPGVLEYRPALHIIEALAEMGGLVKTGSPSVGGVTTVGLQTAIADGSHVVVTHEDGTKQVLDLTNPETKAGTETDILLVPGDVIYVPQELGKINVVGEVNRPGAIPYREDLTLLEVIGDAGGVILPTADLFNAQLTHNGVDRTVNLDQMLNHGDMSANIVLAAGDRLAIPELKNRTFVFGSVDRQTFYLYKPGDRILDALSGVGGPTSQADLGKINVIHSDKVHNTIQMVKINLNDFLLRGNISGNPFISPGDSIYIPRQGHKFSISDITGPLYAVGAVGNAANVIK